MDKSFNFSKIDEIKLSLIYKDIFELDDVFKNLFQVKKNSEINFSLIKKIFFNTKNTSIKGVNFQLIENEIELTPTLPNLIY